jgi:hypothetical protein
MVAPQDTTHLLCSKARSRQRWLSFVSLGETAQSFMKEVMDKTLEYKTTHRVIGRAHYIAADRYTRLNRVFGIPVIVITATVGTTIFGTLHAMTRSNFRLTSSPH